MEFLIILLFSLYCFCECNEMNRKNAEVTFEFLCIENDDDDSEMNLIIELYVTNRTEISLDGIMTDIFSKNEVNFVKGMCIYGIHDTRENLKNIIKFYLQWTTFYIYIKIKKNEFKEVKMIDTLKSKINPDSLIDNGIYEMNPFYSNSKQIFQIKFKLSMKCSANFYGEHCERYCRNISSYFECTKNGSRECLQNSIGQYCNIKKECADNSNCSCKNNTKGIAECYHETVNCQPESSECTDSICQLNLISLTENCIKKPILNSTEIESQAFHLKFLMPITALGGIIIVLLIIILFLAVYKVKRRPITDRLYTPRRHIPLPSIRNQSMIDDFSPSVSEYADMNFRGFSDNSDSTGTYYPNLSLPLNNPNVRLNN